MRTGWWWGVGDDLLPQEGLRVRWHIRKVICNHKYLYDSSIWVKKSLRKRKEERVTQLRELHVYIQSRVGMIIHVISSCIRDFSRKKCSGRKQDLLKLRGV